MAGNQSRGLIAASITRGWDPTVIPANGAIPSESIANFDNDPGNLMNRTPLGQLPGGIPNSYEDGYSRRGQADAVGDAPTFATPDATRESKNRHTTGADPFAGMGGTALTK